MPRQPSAGHSRPGGPPPPTRAGPGIAAGRPHGAGKRRRGPAPLRSCRRCPRAGGASARSASHRFPVPEPGRCGRRWPRRRRGHQVGSACRAAREGAAGPPSGRSTLLVVLRRGRGRGRGVAGAQVPGSGARRLRGAGGAVRPSRAWVGERSPERGAEPGAGSGVRPGAVQRIAGSGPPPGRREAAVG